MVAEEDSAWLKILMLVKDISTQSLFSTFVRKELTRDTDLVVELGLVGDDAFQFMERYAKTLNVARGDFDFSSHFESEELWIFPTFRKKKQRKRITLGMLEHAAIEGVWNSVQLNSLGGCKGQLHEEKQK